MAVTINPALASITVDHSGAVPDVSIQANRVVCHLTQGFTTNEVFDPTRPNKSALAWKGTGKLKVAKGPADNLDLWDFGFVQFQKVNSFSFFFAGKTVSAGAISILAHEAPAMPQKTLLDSISAITPWTKSRPRFNRNGLDVECATGDHPMVASALSLVNRQTNQQNFLFHIVNEREFFTALAAMHDRGAVTYVRHFHWKLAFDFMFNWRNNQPVKARSSSTLTFGTIENGPPTAPELTALLRAPLPPFANDAGKAAVTAAVTGFSPTNRKDLGRRFANVPPTFFQ